MAQTDGELYHVPGLKNQYCENDYTTQSNLQIQYNPHQISSDIKFYNLYGNTEEPK